MNVDENLHSPQDESKQFLCGQMFISPEVPGKNWTLEQSSTGEDIPDCSMVVLPALPWVKWVFVNVS